MSKPKDTPDEITKFQKSESVILNRAEILNAPYNPRKITPEAFKALKKNIKDVGLLGGIVVNKRTMFIVSGHKRLEALDALEKRSDYQIRVEMVDMDEKTEKEQNIFMNSSSVQGEFDLDMLKTMLPDIDYEQAGLTEADLNVIGVVDSIQMFENEDLSDELNNSYEARKQQTKDLKQKIRDGYSDKFETEPVVSLSFSSVKAKQAFMLRFGYDPNAAFVNGDLFSERVERVE